ncbi:MAG: sigma 54-interacting transcriptional regulator [Myxococcaceae bacterium]|nr:sigma 54-interacting transcriptional regulator [Myxococcaceae bacterium]MCI0669088.1 sigma 54-interacting transcriptional regulator [Myxococcaceae bacterium]
MPELSLLEPISTETIHLDAEARFPRARLSVVGGPDAGAHVLLEGQTVVVGSGDDCDLKLTDTSVSRRHMELSGGPGGWRLRDLRSTNGVFLAGLQVIEARLSEKVRIRLGRSELRFEPERTQVHWPLSPRERFGEAWGKSAAIRRVFALLEQAGPATGGIVLEGEPGVGKETLARGVHAQCARKDAPFVVVDVEALVHGTLEADLFGQELTVSGARLLPRPGAFEEAHGGILFLDEVALLPLPLQSRVMRVLETKEVRPLNAPHAAPRPADVRVVASTRFDLEAEVKAGRFREDLFYHLAVFRIRVPPLRERPEDIPGLARQFAQRVRGADVLSEDALEMLQRHDWSGNVQELRTVVERLCAFPDLGAAAVSRALGVEPRAPEGSRAFDKLEERLLALPYHEAKERVLESFERTYFLEHLRVAGGVVTRAAKAAGLPRQSVHRMLRRLGLSAGEE